MPTRDNIVRLKLPIPEVALNLHVFSFGGCSGSLLARKPMIPSSSTVSPGGQIKVLLFNCLLQTPATAARSRTPMVMSMMDMTKVGALRSSALNRTDTGSPSVIYPADWKQYPRNQGVIVDDTMHDIMVRSLPAGCRLTVSC